MTEDSAPAYREPKISDVEDAIDVLLTAYLQQKLNPVGTKQLYREGPLLLMEIADGELGQFIAIVENPLGFVLRDGIFRLGQSLHDLIKTELGATDPLREMVNSVERIAARDPGHEGRRGALLDKIFDGVGDENSRWMA